jgi:NADH:ubiquinone oxidoreductase subunit 3 (subunit A)
MMLHNHISIFISAITIDLLLFCSCPLNAQRKTQEPKKADHVTYTCGIEKRHDSYLQKF